MIKIFTSLLPVFIFLLILIYLDSYKLVKIKTLLILIVVGFVAAIISYFLNKYLLDKFSFDLTNYSRYISPIIEEFLKSVFVFYLIYKKKIGFMVDAAIYGFAVGAGFAFIENIYYLNVVDNSSIFLWIIRGFGTAIMHGGTTAIFAIITKNLFDRADNLKLKNYLPQSIFRLLNKPGILYIMPGLIVAIIIHSIFNHLLLPAFVITVLQLIILPLLITITFYISERTLKEWMETGLDNDVKLLEQIDEGIFSETNAGQYLSSLQDKFTGTVVADMLCLIKIHVELAIKAKGVLLMRKGGLQVIVEDEVKEKLNELKYLEKSIGPVGKLAVSPIFHMSTKDLWQLYFLGLK